MQAIGSNAVVSWRNNGELTKVWAEDTGFQVKFEERGEKPATPADIGFLWRELRSNIPWNTLGRGIFVNKLSERIPICEKAGLYEALMKMYKGIRPIWLPQTYVMPKDAKTLSSIIKRVGCSSWIVKPNGKNRGNGIAILDATTLSRKLGTLEDRTVVQSYLAKPMLLEGRKFDMRMYLLVSCRAPFKAYFAPGYVRRCVRPYSVPTNGMDISIHLTNQSVQKAKCPEYNNDENVKDDSVWTVEQMIASSGKPDDWYRALLTKIEEMARACATCVKLGLKKASPWKEFELFGFDVIVDDDEPLLLEVNTNPALFTNTKTLHAVIPPVLREALNIALGDNGLHESAALKYWKNIVHDSPSCFNPTPISC